MRTLLNNTVIFLIVCSFFAMSSHGADQKGRVLNLGKGNPRYKGTKRIEDPDATDGVAFQTAKGGKATVGFGYSYETMGVYEASFRLKVDDNTSSDPVASISYVCETSKFKKQPPECKRGMTIKGTDFKAPNQYQEFKVRWLAPHVTRNGWQIHTTGKATVTSDKITIRQLRPVNEIELFDYMTGGKKISDPGLRHGRWKAHIMRGYFSDYYLLDLALSRIPGIKVTSSSLSRGGGCAGQPRTPEQIYQQDLIIMAGTGISHLSMEKRLALKKWVEAGGSLLVIGGPKSFGEANMGKSVVGDLLPVALQGPFDLKREKTVFKPAENDTAKKVLKGVDLKKPMVAFFRHKLKLKPKATVIIGTSDDPVLAIWDVGKGRVACLMTPAMGDEKNAADGETPFWNDLRFPVIMEQLVRNLITRPMPKDMAHIKPAVQTSKRAKAIIDSLAEKELDLDLDLDDSVSAEPGKKAAIKFSPQELTILTEEGGKPAVKPLLDAMPGLLKEEEIRSVEWAVRPYLTDKNFDQILTIGKSISPVKQTKQSAIALLGKSAPSKVGNKLNQYLGMQNQPMLRAALRSINEGQLKQYLPKLRQLHKALKAEVEKLRLAKYEGYWFNGIPADDPAWAYAECTMALLKMGEKDVIKDAFDLLFLLHLQDLKIRSFIFLYNPKVPREAENAARHRTRNAFVGPDLKQLIGRLQQTLATIPPSLQPEYRQAIMGIDDFEKLLPLLYPTRVLINDNKDGKWQEFTGKFDKKALEAAIESERF